VFHGLHEFYPVWQYESGMTQKMLDTITDAALSREGYADGRTIGRLAWHIGQTVPEMMGKAGLTVAGPGEHEPVPASAAMIGSGYRTAAASLVEQLQAQWTDATLRDVDEMYGEQWPRAQTLAILLAHQTHHRGQLTVLMRQAGLPIPGIYGPTREEWAGWGMPAPAI
jgi:uncharacterized damage-inducible protein DinB